MLDLSSSSQRNDSVDVSETAPLFSTYAADANRAYKPSRQVPWEGTKKLSFTFAQSISAWWNCPWPWRRPSYWAVIPVIFLAGYSKGPVIAMHSPLLRELFCERGIPRGFSGSPTQDLYHGSYFGHGGDGPSQDPCNSAEYSAAISKFSGIQTSLTALMMTLTVRYWASLSDRIGRKSSLLIWSVGMTISFCIPLMVYIVKDLSVYLLLLESAIEGIAGSSLLLIALTHSYASDLTQIDQRVVVFGRLTAGHYAGIGFGSATAGLLVKRVGLIAALLLMPVIAIICFVYLLLLPESMRSKLQADTTSSLSPSSTLTTIADSGMADINTESDREIANNPTIRVDDAPRKMSDAKQDAGTILYRLEKFYLSLFSPQLPNTLGGKHSVMLLMVTCFIALMGILIAVIQISPYLLYRFHWSSVELGYFGAVQGLSRLVSLTVVLSTIMKFSPKKTGQSPAASISFDLKVVIAGISMEAATMLLYGLSPVGEGFYIGAATSALGSLFFPAVRGILSQSISPDLLGKTMGTVATFESMAAILGPLIGSWCYSQTLLYYPGTVFIVAALFVTTAAVLAISILATHRRSLGQTI